MEQALKTIQLITPVTDKAKVISITDILARFRKVLVHSKPIVINNARN